MNRYHCHIIPAATRGFVYKVTVAVVYQYNLFVNNTRLAMKLALVCLLAIVTVVYVSARPDDTTYTNKYDNIDVDQILNNDRLLKRYTDCLLEKATARCPPEAIELKKVLNEALETECGKCSEYQKEMVKKVIKFLAQNKKDLWNELKAKYDPDGKYTEKYEELANKEDVKL